MYYKKWISVILIMGISLFMTASAAPYPNNERQFIRFHVIANSDSYEDQALKLKVRDRLLVEFGVQLSQSHSIGESRHIILEKIEDIQKIAQQEVDRYTLGYHVKANLGHFDFPTKAYGSMVLPAGNYEALRVVIGKGKGANWWCVMFPPLCFVDITHGVAKDETIAEENQGDNVEIEYRFKILEWWDKAKSLLGAAR